MGGLKSYQLKKLQCLSPYSTSPFYPGGLQWAKNAQKGEIENRPWPYFFSQLDPMLFRIFSLKLIKETPCGHQPVNSNFEFYHPPLLKTNFWPCYFLNPLGNRRTWYKNQQTLKTHVTGRVVAERRVGDEVKLLPDEVEDKMEKQLLCHVGGFFFIICGSVMTSGYQLTLLFIVCFKLACMISDNGCKN